MNDSVRVTIAELDAVLTMGREADRTSSQHRACAVSAAAPDLDELDALDDDALSRLLSCDLSAPWLAAVAIVFESRLRLTREVMGEAVDEVEAMLGIERASPAARRTRRSKLH